MIELNLYRKKETNKQTIGYMEVVKNGVFLFCLSTLELPYLNNTKNISCIPAKQYQVKHYSSEAHPNCFHVQDTLPRTYILIHSGNYYSHTAGCILVGLYHTDLNRDGYQDVAESGEALQKLREVCKGEDEIMLSIK